MAYNAEQARIQAEQDSLLALNAPLPTADSAAIAAAGERLSGVFQGDRFVEGSPTVTLPFMRHEAPFPAGPFAVAGKFRAPVVFYYAMRERGRRYRFIFDIPDEDGCGTKEAILGSYVRSLEAVVRRYPQQWFNFYRFWS